MSLRKDVIAYTLLSCFTFSGTSTELFGISSTWTGAINTAWNSEGNWDNGTPGPTTSSTDTAIFSTAGVGTVSLDSVAISPGLNQLNLNTTGYTIDSSGTTNKLNFNLSGSTEPAINVTGTQIINAFTSINNGTTLNYVLGQGSTLTVKRDIQDSNFGNVVISGSGTMILQPTVPNSGGINVAGSFTQNSGNFQNGTSMAAGGSVISETWTMNGGTYTSTNTSDVPVGVGVDNYAAVNALTINNGDVFGINSVNLTGNNTRGSRFQAATGVVINGGSFTAQNNNDISGSSCIGSELYSGGGSATITISGGTVSLSNSGAISGSATAGSMILSSNQLTMTGGTLNATNSGTISSGSGANISTLSGNFSLSGGTVNLTNSGPSTASGILFFPSGALSFSEGTFNATNTASITGGGLGINVRAGTSLNISGGTMTLSNRGTIGAGSSRGVVFNMAGQPANITGGNISLENSGAINATVGNGVYGTRWIVSNVIMSGGAISLRNSGPVTQENAFCAGSIVQSQNTLTMTGGTVTLYPNTGTLQEGATGGNLLLVANSISLNTGATLINHDAVVTPTITVESTGILAGRGNFYGSGAEATTSVTNKGTLTPGDPGVGASNPGTLTINGGYTQTSTGTLVANVLNNTTYSKLSVTGSTTGTATLDGTLQLSVLPGATISPSDVFTLVQTDLANGVSGTLNLVNNTPIFRPTLTYLPNAVQLALTPVAGTSLNGSTNVLLSTINEINTRATRETARLRNRIRDRTLRNPIASLSREDSSLELIAMNEEISQNKNPTLVQMRHVSFDEKELATPWKLYLGPTGNVGEIFSNNNQIESHYWSAGALVGLDYAFSQGGLGSLFNYNYISDRIGSQGKAVTNEIHMNFYGTCFPENLPQLGLNAIIGGSYEWYRIERNIPSTSLVAVGKPGGTEFDALLGLEYAFESHPTMRTDSRWKFSPLASLQYVHFQIDAYDEQQADFYNLHIDEQTVNSLQTVLGSRFNYTWYQTPAQKYSAEIDFAWQREFLRNDRFLTVSYAEFIAPPTTQLVPSACRNLFLAGINLSALYHGDYGWEASYDFQGNEDYLNHSFYVGFQSRF